MFTQSQYNRAYLRDRVYRQFRYRRGNGRRKKITQRDSMTYTIAALSVELGIPPKDFIDMDPQMLEAIIQVLRDRAKEMKNAASKTASRGRR